MNPSYLIINVGSTSIKTCLFDEGLKAIALLNADYGCAAGFNVDGLDKQGQAFRQYHAGDHDVKTAFRDRTTHLATMACQGQFKSFGHRPSHCPWRRLFLSHNPN